MFRRHRGGIRVLNGTRIPTPPAPSAAAPAEDDHIPEVLVDEKPLAAAIELIAPDESITPVPIFNNSYAIGGMVYLTSAADNPISRPVIAISSTTGKYLGTATARVSDGLFEIPVWVADPVTIIAMPTVADARNAVIHFNVIPVVY